MFFKRLLLALSLALCLAPVSAFADGFAVVEWSAGGVGMGEAYMFADHDPALLAYNPAGITRLKGSYVGGGMTYINPRGRVDFSGGIGNGETWSNREAPGFVPNLFFTRQASETVTWGIGFFTRFGNSSEYDESFPGRFNNYKAKITSLSAAPTVAWQVTPKLSLSLGAEIMYMALDAREKIGVPSLAELDFHLDGDGFGYGWNVGLNYDFNEKTSFAAVYRSRIDMELKGDAKTTIQTVSGLGEVTLPDSLTVGLGHKLNDRTRVEIGATHTWWSTYDRLTIDFTPSIHVPLGPGISIPQQSTRKDWENSWRFQAGVEHRMDDRWTIMFGYAYDNTPIPDDTIDFMVPTGDRQTVSVGFKHHRKNAVWTFAYGFMWIDDRVIPGVENGANSYFGSASVRDSTAHIISIGYTVKLN